MKRTVSLLLIAFSLVAILSSCDTHNHTDSFDSHDFGEWVILVPPTCDTDGKKVRYCPCGARHEDIAVATEHKFVNGVCEKCGEKNDEYDPNVDSADKQ